MNIRIYSLACVDFLIIGGSFFLAYMLRVLYMTVPIQSIGFYYFFILYSLLLFYLGAYIYGVYRHQSPLSFGGLTDFLRAYGFWVAGIVVLAFLAKAEYSRLLIVLFSIISGCLLVGIRMIYYPIAFPVSVTKDARMIREVVLSAEVYSFNQLELLEGIKKDRGYMTLYLLIKRCIDIAGACVGLCLTAICAPFIVYAIRRDTPGSIFITQDRVGLHGKVFSLYKFRTMQQHTTLYARAPQDGNDNRVTRVGRVLRKYSFDELPQFWNVLKGDMSLVGPRPEMSFIVAQYSDIQRVRLSVKPGITGMWQILGRKDMPLEHNIEYDIYYVFHRSLLLDSAILIRTIPHLMFPKGAY